MDLEGKRIVIFVDNLYQEMELWYPYFRFLEAGAEVLLAGAEAGATYTSKLGYPAKSDVSYRQLAPKEFDGVIVPGGYAPDRIRRYETAIQFVRDMDTDGKLVAAICHGPWVLCSANILKNRGATSFFAIKDDVIHAGAQWKDAAVVTDGNLVTSRTPDDLPAFCRACLKVLADSPVLV